MSKEKKQNFATAGLWTFLFVLSIFTVLGLGKSYVTGRNEVSLISSAYAATSCADGMTPVCGQCKATGFSTMTSYPDLYVSINHNFPGGRAECLARSALLSYESAGRSTTWAEHITKTGSCMAWYPSTVATSAKHFIDDRVDRCYVQMKTKSVTIQNGLCEDAASPTSEVVVTTETIPTEDRNGRWFLETETCTKTTTYPTPAPCRSKNVPAEPIKVTYDPPSCAPAPSPSSSGSPSPSPSSSPSSNG